MFVHGNEILRLTPQNDKEIGANLLAWLHPNPFVLSPSKDGHKSWFAWITETLAKRWFDRLTTNGSSVNGVRLK